jgi:glycosyltransferase involved in cell wall biosynthesis
MLAGEYPPAMGGVADYTALLCDALEALGNTVNVITAQSGASCSRTVHVPGWGLASIREVAKRISATDPDIVHLQYQAAAFDMSGVVALFPLVLRRSAARAAFITTFHDLRVPYLFPKAGPLRQAIPGTLLGMSAASIFVDPGDIIAARPRRPAAWIPVGSAIDPLPNADPAMERARLGIAPDSFVIAHFGFINASKGVDVLLDASERLVRAGLDLTLLFVGDDAGSSDSTNAATAQQMRARAATLGLDERIVRTGALSAPDVARALVAADVAALPFRDGASMRHSSLMACFAQGLPVVTTRPRWTSPVPARHLAHPFGESTQSWIDESVAEMTPPGDAAALARSIYRLANDPPRSQFLAKAGRQLADAFNWKSIAEATANVYQQGLASRQPGR